MAETPRLPAPYEDSALPETVRVVTRERKVIRAHAVTILESGWLQVTYGSGSVSYLSPAGVTEVYGKGVTIL